MNVLFFQASYLALFRVNRPCRDQTGQTMMLEKERPSKAGEFDLFATLHQPRLKVLSPQLLTVQSLAVIFQLASEVALFQVCDDEALRASAVEQRCAFIQTG